jgi:hypothetical protein
MGSEMGKGAAILALITVLAAQTAYVQAADVCKLGDIECDGKVARLCWDDNKDGYLEWSYNFAYNMESEDACRNLADVSVITSIWGFDIWKEETESICRAGETMCTLDGKGTILCNDNDGDGIYDYTMDWQSGAACRYGCNYVFTPGAVYGKIAAECNPGPGYCPLQCSLGETYCNADGITYTICQMGNDGCPEFSDEGVGMCDYGCATDSTGKGYCLSQYDSWLLDAEGDEELTQSILDSAGMYGTIVPDAYTWVAYNFSDNECENGAIMDIGKNNMTAVPNQEGKQTCNTTFGKYGKGLEINPSSNSAGTLLFNNTGYLDSGTISFWFLCTTDYEWTNDLVRAYTLFNGDSDIWDNAIFISPRKIIVNDSASGGLNRYEMEYVPDRNLCDGKWHKLVLTFGSKWNLYIDSYFVKTEATPDKLSLDPYYGYYYSSLPWYTSDTFITSFMFDEFEISEITKAIAPGCQNRCLSGDTKCVSSGEFEYSMNCTDYDGNGCTDWLQPGSYCEYGCNDYTGRCYTADNRNDTCNLGNWTCGPASKFLSEYEIPCAVGANGLNYWNETAASFCFKGCDEHLGRCNEVKDECTTTETYCCKELLVTEEMSRESLGALDWISNEYDGKLARSVCGCADGNGDGYLEEGGSVVEYCGETGWCEFDNWPNGTSYAWCGEMPDEVEQAKAAIDLLASSTETAFPNTQKPLIAFGASGFASLLFGFLGSRMRKESSGGAMGVLAFVSVMCMFIWAGWLPSFIAVGLVAMATFVIYKTFMGDE